MSARFVSNDPAEPILHALSSVNYFRSPLALFVLAESPETASDLLGVTAKQPIKAKSGGQSRRNSRPAEIAVDWASSGKRGASHGGDDNKGDY
jgi:hypothetical protein